MVQIDIVYQGRLRTEATHGPSKTTVVTDAPVDNHGRGESFSPTDLVATALGSCMLTIMGIVAERRGLDLSGTRVVVEKHMVSDPVRRIGRLPVKITLNRACNAEERKLLEAAALTCPVHKSLHPDIDKPVTFVYPN
ncbi:MAG: OsmC family protein [Planctomycetes bacterium]|nr:OsmC family protein [Planctomycetota bacterium]